MIKTMKKKIFKEKNMTITKNIDAETIIRAENDKIRVELVNIGEGYHGDYNPEDPLDENLLRFDVYYRNPEDSYPESWTEVDDASYCTRLSADLDEEILERAVKAIFNRYNAEADNIIGGISVKKMGEELSWISENDFMDDKER
jgi:hypothetical protein